MTKPSKKNTQMPKGQRPKPKKGTFKRVMKYLFADYKLPLVIAIICVIFSTVASTSASLFLNQIVTRIEDGLKVGWTAETSRSIVSLLAFMAGIYVIGIITTFTQGRIMAVVTQGFLNNLRKKMFSKMQNLPIKYFDTHPHGDTMSYYTNDIDTLRQLVSQAVPSLIMSALTITILVAYMLYLSVWMTLIVFGAVIMMMFVVKFVGGNSAKYFLRQQKAIGETEGYIEEMMSGQKVVKVFNHEEECCKDFDEINNRLFKEASKAHSFANILMPIMGNIGNILYVIIAFIGGILILSPNVTNVSFSGQALGLAVVIPFINMTTDAT